MPNRNSMLLVVGLAFAASQLGAQEAEASKKFNIVQGPAKAKLGSVAEIQLPTGYAFLDGNATRALLKASGESPTGNELGFLRPTNGDWSVIFEFSDIGYVKDDDKDELDAAKLLQSYKDGTAAQNKQREAAGRPPLIVEGWEQEPHYDAETHNLTWAIRASSGGEPLLNYNTRLLGRKGVMEVVLICDPKDLPGTLPTFKTLLSDYKFESGQTYAEYRPGDKVAKYGLAALVTAGAAVGAAKLGLLGPVILFFKKAWKLLVVAVVAVAASAKKLLSRLFGRGSESIPRE